MFETFKLDPPVSVFSLSLYRHPFLYTLFSSLFTLIINNSQQDIPWYTPPKGRWRSHNFWKFEGPVLNCRGGTHHHGDYWNELVIDEIRNNASLQFSKIFHNFLSTVVKHNSSSVVKFPETFSIRGWLLYNFIYVYSEPLTYYSITLSALNPLLYNSISP